jgi:hypothetical protein
MTRQRDMYYGFIFAAMLLSCGEQRRSDDNRLTGADTLLSKTISFPEGLYPLAGRRSGSLDSLKFQIKGRKKIISIVDGTCMSCVAYHLNAMDSTLNRVTRGKKCALIFILNVRKKDSSYFMLNLQPAIRATGIILWDKNYAFETQNKLFTEDINLRTFMTNAKDEIIQYGNPLMNPELISLYMKNLEND